MAIFQSSVTCTRFKITCEHVCNSRDTQGTGPYLIKCDVQFILNRKQL